MSCSKGCARLWAAEEYVANMSTRYLWSDGNTRFFGPTARGCPNAAVCGEFALPDWLLARYGGLCRSCRAFTGRLTVTRAAGPCPACHAPARRAVALPCGHRVCARCYVLATKLRVYGHRREAGGGCARCARA